MTPPSQTPSAPEDDPNGVLASPAEAFIRASVSSLMAPARMSWYMTRAMGALWAPAAASNPAETPSDSPMPSVSDGPVLDDGASDGATAPDAVSSDAVRPDALALNHGAAAPPSDRMPVADVPGPSDGLEGLAQPSLPPLVENADDDMSWTEERVTQLKDMWDRGEPASVIAKTLDVTRNAVIGKAHRLGLAARPSPIRRGSDGEGAKPAKAEKIITILDLTERTCRWPIGDPLKPGFRFCGAPVNPGVSYCQEHALLAFQQSGPRRDERQQQAAANAAAEAATEKSAAEDGTAAPAETAAVAPAAPAATEEAAADEA